MGMPVGEAEQLRVKLGSGVRLLNPTLSNTAGQPWASYLTSPDLAHLSNRTVPLQQTHKVGGEADGGKHSTRSLTLVTDGKFYNRVAFLAGVRTGFLLKALCLWGCPSGPSVVGAVQVERSQGGVSLRAWGPLTLALASLSWSSSSEKLKLETVMKSLMTGTNLSFGSRT